MTVHFAMVWVGQRYGAEYPAALSDMIQRNASRLEDKALWCITDRPDELPPGVKGIAHDETLPGYWQKVRLFAPDMPWSIGDRIVYLDLDVCVTGGLEALAETPGIIKDWLWPGYNSSVMVWDHGEHADVWSAFSPEIMHRSPGPIVPPECLAQGMINGGDQEWITERAMASEPWPILQPGWCVNYRLHAQDWPSVGAKVVSFNGFPKPHEVTEGWVPDVWKVGGFTSLPLMDGMNVEHDEAFDHVRENSARELPWFVGHLQGEAKVGSVVLIGGAPSMRDNLPEIRAQRRRGAKIVTVNNAWRFLVENGITPDAHVMLDARAENAEFVRDAPAGVRYFLASQCHPDVFEALADREVIVWHNGIGDNVELRAALAPWWDEGPNQKPCMLIPGGGTVGLRALWLLAFSGYRNIHVYGMDSSYADDGAHHAYPQALNDHERTIQVALKDRKYACALWMARQAEEFRGHWHDLRREGVQVFVHGRGLVPDLARALREEARA